MNLLRREGVLLLTDDPPVPAPPHLAAVLEARGALLTWRIDGAPADREDALPEALIHDAAAAAQWIGDLYGPQVADAVRRGAVTTGGALQDLPAGLTASAARLLAHLSWCAAWWPAGRAVPPLATGLIAAEAAVRTSAVEHLLDDPDAVERALTAARGSLPAVAAADGALAAVLRDLAEDNGIPLDALGADAASTPATAGSRADWALAAGGAAPATGIPVASGTAMPAWAGAPPQTVAADAPATWSIVQRSGVLSLRVSVPAVAPGATLIARFGPDDIALALSYDGAEYAAETAVPPTVLRLREADRTLRVHDSRMADAAPPPEPAAEREAVLAFAARRLADPWTLAESAVSGDPR